MIPSVQRSYLPLLRLAQQQVSRHRHRRLYITPQLRRTIIAIELLVAPLTTRIAFLACGLPEQRQQPKLCCHLTIRFVRRRAAQHCLSSDAFSSQSSIGRLATRISSFVISDVQISSIYPEGGREQRQQLMKTTK